MALPDIVQGWPTRRQIEWVLRQVADGRLTSTVASDEMHAIVMGDRESFLERALQVHICSFGEDD